MKGLGVVNGVDLDAHWPLVERMARRFARRWRGTQPEEFYGAGWHGLKRAAEKHDAARGPFEALASKCVWGSMIDHLRELDVLTVLMRARVRRGEFAFSMSTFTDMESHGEDQREFLQGLAQRDEAAAPFDGESFAALVKPLGQRERALVRARLVHGQSIKELAAEFGVTVEALKYQLSSAIAQLEPRARALRCVA